jgi:hypothetical protein
VDPPGLIGGQAARRHKAVQVWMQTELLIPGMEYGKETYPGPHSLRIGSDGEQSF